MARRRRRRQIKFKIQKDTAQSIAAVVLLLAGVLSFLSFFSQAAGFGSAVQEFLNFLFGWGVIFVPFILLLGGLLLLRTIRWPFVRLRVLIGLVMVTLSFLGLVHFFFSPAQARVEAEMGEGGGLIGFFIQLFLRQLLSPFGAFFFLLAFSVVSVLVLFNTSLDSFLAFFLRIGHFFLDRLRRPREAAKRTGEDGGGGGEDSSKSAESAEGEEPAVSPPADEDFDSFEIIPLASPPASPPKTAVSDASELKASAARAAPPRRQPAVWKYPPLTLLSDGRSEQADRGDVKKNADLIERTLSAFGVDAKVVEVNLGPAVTQYAIDLAEGTKVSKVVNLQNNLAMALAAPTGMVRIEAPIPGKSLIGIEVPNYRPSLVTLKDILSSQPMQEAKSKLTVALGHDVSGEAILDNLAKMPHVLIAGTTGSGKSVLLNAFLATLLFRNSPDELKLILVDTKRVEFSAYNEIPHLLHPVIVEPEKVLSALKWAVGEMEKRYRILQEAQVKNVDSYNDKSGVELLPQIIILVDELADLMSFAPGEVEKSVCRLAQMARAVGIHLVLATQRPSVDVLTGLIKANIPCRIAFQVASQIDSRVIIDMSGAEKLLGQGDMLYLPPDKAKPMRIRGVYVSDGELNKLRDFLRGGGFETDYLAEVTEGAAGEVGALFDEADDELFGEAVEVVCRHGRASASLLQRRLRVGYARAARLLDTMEERGVVSPPDGSNPREVLIDDPGAAS